MKGVRKKILIPLTIFALVAVLSAAMNVHNFQKIKDDTAVATNNSLQGTISLDELTINTDKLPKLLTFYCLQPDKAEEYNEGIEYSLGQIEKHMGYMKDIQPTDDHKKIYGELETLFPPFVEKVNSVWDLLKSEKYEEAMAIAQGELLDEANVLEDKVFELVLINDEFANQETDGIDKQIAQAKLVCTVAGVVALVCFIIIVLMITNTVVRPLTNINKSLMETCTRV